MLKSRIEYYFYEVFCAPAMSLLLDEGCSRELGTVIEGEGLRQDRLRLAIEFLNLYTRDILQYSRRTYKKTRNLIPTIVTGKYSDFLIHQGSYYQAVYEEQLRTGAPYDQLGVNKVCKIFSIATCEPDEGAKLIIGYAKNPDELINKPEGTIYAFREYGGIYHANIDASNIDQYLLRQLYSEFLRVVYNNVAWNAIPKRQSIVVCYARKALELSRKYAEKEARGETIEEPMVESVE